eukprot:9726015-Alexandrium_andersonii.AAC.1
MRDEAVLRGHLSGLSLVARRWNETPTRPSVTKERRPSADEKHAAGASHRRKSAALVLGEHSAGSPANEEDDDVRLQTLCGAH